MSSLKSRPPSKSKRQLEEFISGADEKITSTTASKEKKLSKNLPWEKQEVRKDVIKVYNLRLSEPYLLKLKYIAEHTPHSMQRFCLEIIEKEIDKKIKELTK